MNYRIRISIIVSMACLWPFIGCGPHDNDQNLTLDDRALIEKCANFPHHQVLNWEYLAGIHHEKLVIDSKKRYFNVTDEDKTFTNGTKYKKLRVAPDGSCYIRATNLILLEQLFFTNTPLKKSDVTAKLLAILPYRNKSLGELPVAQIAKLIDHLSSARNFNELLTMLNHPCNDLALEWLVRDLAWAMENKKYLKNLAKLEKMGFSFPSDDIKPLQEFCRALPISPSEPEITKKRNYAHKALSRYCHRNISKNGFKHHSYGDQGGSLESYVKSWQYLFGSATYEVSFEDSQKTNIKAVYQPLYYQFTDHDQIASDKVRIIILHSSNQHSDALVRQDLLGLGITL